MADTTALKNRIRAAIKANDNQEITGPVLQQALLDMVDELDLYPELESEANIRQQADTTLNNLITGIKNNIDNGYVYAGIATPSTSPVSGKVFYIAKAAGTYTNFDGQVLTQGINILRYNGSAWSNQQLIGIDDVAVNNSKNLIGSGFVYQYNQSSSLRSGKIEKVLFKNRITDITLSSGAYEIDDGVLNYFESKHWKYAIVPINNIARIKTAAGTVSSSPAKIPAIIYLSGVDPTQANFISGYEQYAVVNANVGIFDSGLVIPEGATHIIVNLSTLTYNNIELYDGTFFDVDDKPIAGSNNLVKSGGIYDALQNNPRFTLFKKENIAKSPIVASAEQIITGIYLENADGTPVEYTKEINGVTYYLGILSIRQGKPNNNIKRTVSIGYAPMDGSNTFDRFVVLGNTETVSYVGVEHMIAHNIQGFKTVEIWVDWDKYDETIESASSHQYDLYFVAKNGSITTYRYKRDYKYIGIDQQPVQNSTNPITSGAVYEINGNLNNKINTINEVLAEEKQTKTTDITTVYNKAVVMQNGIPVEISTSGNWRYGIIPVAGLKHVITFSSFASHKYPAIIAIIFLRTNEITQDSYIAGSEKYGTGKTPDPNIAKFDEDIVIPSEANYVIINCAIPYADDTTVITRDVFYDLSEFDERITELEQQKKVLTVKKQPGEGEYGTIAAALAVADSETTIYIHTGVYEENHLNLPRGITIIGIGDVEIRGYLPPSTAIATSTNYSTLECYNGATLENLKITAQNMRYPIHADFSDGNAKWNVKNCIFEHKGNKEINDYWATQTGDTSGIISICSAWGGGTRGGDNVYCFNCKFISTGRAFSTHNNAETSYENYGASHVVLESCEMISKGIDRDGVLVDLLASLFIQSLNCPVDGCDVVVNNCSLNGYIVFQNSGGDGWSNKLKVFNCGKNKIAFSGYGSGPSLIRNGGQITTYQSHYDKYPLISDCCHSFVNRGASAITKGKAVKLTNNGGVELYDSTADDVFGVAMQDIAVGEVGDVWFDGYLSRIWLDGIRKTDITEGSNIYVDNTGSFATSGTKIAFKVVDNQNIKL